MNRSECRKDVESLAYLHEGYPEVLASDLKTRLTQAPSIDARRVYGFALARTQDALAKISALSAQIEQYRVKATRLGTGEESYLERMAREKEGQIEGIKSTLSMRLFDRRYV